MAATRVSAVSAHTNRVPVLDGHTMTVSVRSKDPTLDA
jgi:aspartate-semialdehyde dehydrogenase